MGENAVERDLVVIGGGPGGYVAAIRAAQLGARVTVVESGELGGTCLNRGCIPTKALVSSVEVLEKARKASQFGIKIDGRIEPDLGAMIDRKNEIVGRLVKGIHFLFKKNKVELERGTGSLEAAGRVRVRRDEGTEALIEASKIIVATGSSPHVFPGLGYDGERVVTSDEALDLRSIPQRVCIIGGGVIGCEFASILASLGSDVTIIEMMPTLLPMVDKEISRQIQSSFKRRRIKIHTGAKVVSVDKSSSGDAGSAKVKLALDSGTTVDSDLVLVSVGRKPNTDGIGLETVDVKTNDRGEIIVDSGMCTSVASVYAIGDVTDCPWKLAHVASAQGLVAAANALGGDRRMSYDAVPNCIFTSPEIACVGASADALPEGRTASVSKFPFLANGRALTLGEAEGFVKLVADSKDGKLIGAQIIGPHASELISELALAITAGLTQDDVTETIHAHPTLPEAVMEAAEGLSGMAIHM